MAKVTSETRLGIPAKKNTRTNLEKSGRPVAKGKTANDSVKGGSKPHDPIRKEGLVVSRGRKERSALEEPEIVYRSLNAIMAPTTVKPESQMTPIEKMEVTREGISKKALEELKLKTGFDYDQLANVLGVARTTLINKKGKDRFPLVLSEKIMSLADLYSFGYEIFGDQHQFNQWIFEPLAALGGQAPYDLLNSQYGREEIKNLIGRIAYGTYS